MQFRGSRIRLIIANLNIVTQWCAENINIIASNIPQMKIIAVSQWTARFNMQRKPEKCWFLLRNLSFGLFDHKKIPGLFQDFPKFQQNYRTFQDFPGLSIISKILFLWLTVICSVLKSDCFKLCILLCWSCVILCILLVAFNISNLDTFFLLF